MFVIFILKLENTTSVRYFHNKFHDESHLFRPEMDSILCRSHRFILKIYKIEW